MRHETGTFTGLDGVEIFTQGWLPDEGTPRAVVLIAHGYAEHSGRYVHVAAYLVERGYAVHALDHRGHGRSGGARAQVHDFSEFVTDLRTCFEHVRARHPDLPIFLYGHSMGSLIALLFALRWQDELAGLITSGTALRLGGVKAWLVPAVKLLSQWRPSWSPIPPLQAAGISRDLTVVEQYVHDPLVYRGPMRLGMAAALLRASRICAERLGELRLPYLALHGGADPLTLPEGAALIRARSGSADTTVHVFEGLYHEVHNEPEREQVLTCLVDWLDAHVGQTHPLSAHQQQTSPVSGTSGV
jgi:alpha-beta hydrolase superfamily lysophospholipase